MTRFNCVCEHMHVQSEQVVWDFILRRPAAAICLLLTIAGCRQADQIETYAVPKEVPRAVVAVDTPAGPESKESTDRMLAAILPDGGKAWFLKVVGPEAAIAEREQSINEFFAKVRPAAEKAHPDWKLPEGWEPFHVDNGFRRDEETHRGRQHSGHDVSGR